MSLTVPGIAGFPMEVATKLRGTDPCIVERMVSNLIEPRRIRLLARQSTPDIRVSHVVLSFGHVFGVQHGSAVHVTSAPIASWQIMVPLRGHLLGHADGAEITAAPGSALVYAPQDPLNTYWSEDCVALVLSISAERLRALVRATLPGFALDDMPARSLMPLTSGSGRSFANALGVICQESVDPDSAFSRGLTAGSLEETLLLSLLLAQRQNAPTPVIRGACVSRQTCVGRAIDYIDAHCADDVTLADLVQVTGVSARTLQYGFMEQFGVGPMTYLKPSRMRCIRDALRKARPGLSIGDVAAQWGFYNGSTFARLYRRMFGELPSETLRTVASSARSDKPRRVAIIDKKQFAPGPAQTPLSVVAEHA